MRVNLLASCFSLKSVESGFVAAKQGFLQRGCKGSYPSSASRSAITP